jgi:hypothetical protein
MVGCQNMYDCAFFDFSSGSCNNECKVDMCLKHEHRKPCYLCELEESVEREIENREINKVNYG